jgi:hypothetical protein
LLLEKQPSLVKTLSVDYTIDYQNNNIVFNTAPSQGAAIDILSISFNSANILDLDYFIFYHLCLLIIFTHLIFGIFNLM